MMTVGDRIRIEAQIAVLKEIALDYKGRQSTTLFSS